MTDIYYLNGISGAAQRRCKNACGAQFYNSLLKDDVRFKPCKSWCESKKPEQETPPDATFFNQQLGISPTPPNAPVFKSDLKTLQSLSNTSASNQKSLPVEPNFTFIEEKFAATGAQNVQNAATGAQNVQNAATGAQEDNTKKIVIGLGVGTLLIGIGIAIFHNN